MASDSPAGLREAAASRYGGKARAGLMSATACIGRPTRVSVPERKARLMRCRSLWGHSHLSNATSCKASPPGLLTERLVRQKHSPARLGGSASLSRLPRHEMSDRLDVVFVQGISDLRHDDIAAAPPRAVLVIMQRLDDEFLALTRKARHFALARECLSMALGAMAFIGELSARLGQGWIAVGVARSWRRPAAKSENRCRDRGCPDPSDPSRPASSTRSCASRRGNRRAAIE